MNLYKKENKNLNKSDNQIQTKLYNTELHYNKRHPRRCENEKKIGKISFI